MKISAKQDAMAHGGVNRKRLLGSIGAVMATISMAESSAMPIDVDNPDLKLRWDNTVKYSNAFRLSGRSATLTADANADDGDRNFGRGLISNRVDLLSEFDGSYKNFGMRVSGAAWYDTVYNRTNDNNSPATSNNVSVPYNEFTKATRDRMGRKAELLDAFFYAKGSIGDTNGTIRLGRHSLLFGESLFFGANGIANAQGPIDLVKLLSVPGSQFKEVLRPVPQVSGQLQLTPNLSASAYYQFRWEQSILPPAGSYLSTLDYIGEGAERVGPFLRGNDMAPRNSGQGGLQLRYRIVDWDTEVGVFAARYHNKTPNLYLTLDPRIFAPANLVHAYAEGIRTFGASLSKTVGAVNLAGEVSVRDNAPLVSDPQVVVAGMADNHGQPAYAVGKTLHAQVSAIHSLETSPLWQGGILLFEAAWNRRASISANPQAVDPNTTRDAYAFRVLLAPAYYQVLPGLDITVPIGLGYNPKGKSSAVVGFNGGVSHGGDFSIGLTGNYENTWQFGVNYVRFLGREDSAVARPKAAAAYLTYGQALHDRQFVSFTANRTF